MATKTPTTSLLGRSKLIKKVRTHRLALAAKLKNVKAIYTDLDNTLLGPGGCFFCDSNRELTLTPASSLIDIIRAGIDVIIISGRNAVQLREITRLMGLRNFIAELGCLISYNNEQEEIFRNYQYKHPIDKTLYQAIAGSRVPELLLTTYPEQLEYHTPWSRQRECTHLFRGVIDTAEANALLENNGFLGLKLIDNGQVRTKGTLIHLDSVHAYHLLPSETSKASAILLDRMTRGLAAEEVIALGDSLADIEMASAVGHFFLVRDHVKADENLSREIARYDNIYMTDERMNLGWAEVARMIID